MNWICDGCKATHQFPGKVNFVYKHKHYCIDTYPGRKLKMVDGMRVKVTVDQAGIKWLADCIPAGTMATLRLMKLAEHYSSTVPTLHFDGYTVSRQDNYRPFCTLRYAGEYVLSEWFDVA
jgi:hypothetical protein